VLIVKKKILAGIMAVALTLSGCAGKTNDKPAANDSNAKKTVVLWGFSQTDLEPIKKLYEEANENTEVKLVIKSPADYPNLLKQVLTNSTDPDSPDVFVMDIVYAKLFIDSNLTANLSSLSSKAKDAGIFQYVQDIGKDSKGTLKALSWQSTPGGFYYRRSLAKEYLGTDEPEKVYEAVKDLDTFKKTAANISAKSNGTVSIVSSRNELQFAMLYSRSSSWIKDGKLNIDDNVYKLMDLSKEFYENRYEALVPKLYDKEWYSTMRDNYKIDGKTQYVLGYLLPTWALSNHFEPNAKPTDGTGKDTTGDWAITQAPVNYIRGGSWIAVNEKSRNKEEAVKFIETVTTNVDFMENMARVKGDFSSSDKVNAKLGQGYSSAFLGGQNPFEVFNKLGKNVNASNLASPYDNVLNNLFAEQLNQYAIGNKSKEKAIEDFKAAVNNQFVDVIKVD
jgi:multiple sugar transport system substrate-binding protein